ncbi:MAG: hypothetical protein J1E42_08895, partial [Akkermansiaceae bacterium]|nr:hypothetical protein [Akkermansiaceae bacterium]
MKLHLPSVLRKIVMAACMCSAPGLLSYTATLSGGVVAGGSVWWILAGTPAAAAVEITGAAPTLSTDNVTEEDGVLVFNEAEQNATVDATGAPDNTLHARRLTINADTALSLSTANESLLTANDIDLFGTLTLNTQGVLDLANTTFSPGSSTGTLKLNYDTTDTLLLDTDFLSSSFTGTLTIAKGAYELSAQAAAELGVSELRVERLFNFNTPANATGGTLYLGEGAYDLNLVLQGGGRDHNVPLSLSGGTILRGDIAFSSNADGVVFSVRNSSDENPAVIYSNVDANQKELHVTGTITGMNNSFIEFREGTLSNFKCIRLGGVATVSIYQDFSPENTNGQTSFTTYRAAGDIKDNNTGFIYMYGKVSGFEKFDVGHGVKLYICDTFEAADSGTLLLTSGGGGLYMQGDIVGLKQFSFQADSVNNPLYIEGDLQGGPNDTLVITGGGKAYFAGNSHSTHSGKLQLEGGGTTYLGDAQNSTVSISFSEIEINNGHTLQVHHASADFSGTGISLKGGATLRLQDMSDGPAPIIFGTLANEGNNTLMFIYKSGLEFTDFTGSGTLTLAKEWTDSENASELLFDQITDYNGSVLWTTDATYTDDNHRNNLSIILGAVNQSATSQAVFGAQDSLLNNIQSTDFVMSGEGRLTVWGNHTASGTSRITGGTYEHHGLLSSTGEWEISGGHLNQQGNMILYALFNMSGGEADVQGTLQAENGFLLSGGRLGITGELVIGGDLWMVGGGQLDYADAVTLLTNTALRYKNRAGETPDAYFDYLETESHLNLDADARLYIYAQDFDTEALMSEKGVNLYINTADVSAAQLLALGYAAGEYEIVADEGTGTWWLRANCAPHAEAESTDGIWDPAWGTELRNRPISGDMHAYDLNHAFGYNACLADSDEYYMGRSTEGMAYWAEFRSGSLNYNIVGGTTNRHAEDVHADSWILVTAGSYGGVIGGNNAQPWSREAPKITFD